jgi:hypothetical protein
MIIQAHSQTPFVRRRLEEGERHDIVHFAAVDPARDVGKSRDVTILLSVAVVLIGMLVAFFAVAGPANVDSADPTSMVAIPF